MPFLSTPGLGRSPDGYRLVIPVRLPAHRQEHSALLPMSLPVRFSTMVSTPSS